MADVNILITSASAKIGLITAFQGAGARVTAVDSDAGCAARDYADYFYAIPQDDAADYTRCLLDICSQRDISLIVPTRDGELLRLASLQETLKPLGILVPLPSEKDVRRCLDKKAFHDFCLKNNYPVLPAIEPVREAPWPLFVRRRQGSAGKGAGELRNWQHWLSSGYDQSDVICQTLLRHKEYSVDVLLDLEGRPLQAVARERVNVINGESSEAVITAMPQLEMMSLTLCRDLGLKGHNVVQAFCDGGDNIYFIEVNARFGGGSLMSDASGLASVERLLQMVRGASDSAMMKRKIVHGRYSNAKAVKISNRAAP